jgi:hypothetical protein
LRRKQTLAVAPVVVLAFLLQVQAKHLLPFWAAAAAVVVGTRTSHQIIAPAARADNLVRLFLMAQPQVQPQV